MHNAPYYGGYGMMGPGYGGYGMMGPGMGGYGMMGPGYAWNMQGLSDEQLRQMREIRDQSMKQQREIMRKMWDEQVHLQDLLESDDRDPEAISEVYGRIAALRQKAFKQHLIMENRMEKVLGKEQRAQMRRNFHERMMGY